MKAIDYLMSIIRGRDGEWRVKDLMSRDIVTISPDSTMHEAVEKMQSIGIHGMVVAKDGKPMGMISTYDVLLLMARRDHGKHVTVEEVMSTELVTTTQDADVIDAIELMLSNHILRLPVIEGGEIVGIITATDLIDSFDKGFEGESPEEMKAGSELRVENIMHKPVVTIDSNKSVFEAAKLMSKKKIGSLVIEERGKVGIITENDIFGGVVAEGRDSKETRVSDIMTSPCKTTAPKTDILQASRIMHDQSIKRLPVVKKGRLVGIITSDDIVEAISLRRRL